MIYLLYEKNNSGSVLTNFSQKQKYEGVKYVGSTPIHSSQEEFEDTKGVIRICNSKDRQHNNKKKKDKRTNNDLQNIHIKLKIE